MRRNRRLIRAVALAGLGSLTACGGGGATVGGILSGLASGNSVVLQNNAADNLTLSSNGSFAFATPVKASSAYSVSVLVQPTGQSCSVINASGTVNASVSSVTVVAVWCVSTATVSGSVSGLNAGTAVTLSNGSTQLPVAVNGTFAFPGVLTPGSAYNIYVAVQPYGQICSVQNGSGTVVSGEPVNVAVVCR